MNVFPVLGECFKYPSKLLHDVFDNPHMFEYVVSTDSHAGQWEHLGYRLVH